jgi:hypothetical protein
MSDRGRSGVSPWLVGLVGFLLYRRGRRRGEERGHGGSGEDGRDRWGGRPDGRGPLREVRLPDGREALEVTASMFEPDPAVVGGETWRRIPLDGTAGAQEAFELTLTEVAAGARSAEDVPVVLMPLGTRRRVNAVDVYATGGRLGHLPEHAVRAVGDSIRATHLADDRPCAVRARIAVDPSGALSAEVLLPETFTPGRASSGR